MNLAFLFQSLDYLIQATVHVMLYPHSTFVKVINFFPVMAELSDLFRVLGQ
jgi:hypothetical protein